MPRLCDARFVIRTIVFVGLQITFVSTRFRGALVSPFGFKEVFKEGGKHIQGELKRTYKHKTLNCGLLYRLLYCAL